MKIFLNSLLACLVFALVPSARAEQINLYDSVQSINAPEGYVVLSESSIKSSVLKKFHGNRQFNAAGYAKRPEGTYYVSDWSLEQNKATGRAPSWIFIVNPNDLDALAANVSRTTTSPPPSAPAPALAPALAPAAEPPIPPSSGAATLSVSADPNVDKFVQLLVGQSMLYTLASDYQEQVSNGKSVTEAQAELKSRAKTCCLNMGLSNPGDSTDELRAAYRALGDGAEYDKAVSAVFGAFKSIEMQSLSMKIQDPGYSYFLKLRQDLSTQYEAMKEGKLAIRKFSSSLPWNS